MRPRDLQCHRVVVNVPATSANLGPGFDSFGFALDVWNKVTVERSDKFSMTISGEGADRLVADEKNMVVRLCKHAAETLGHELPPLKIDCQNAVRLHRQQRHTSPAGQQVSLTTPPQPAAPAP